ncbi:MAG: hypothetical protein ABH865_03395, partial [Candidatus Omnitrophota bacterium]
SFLEFRKKFKSVYEVSGKMHLNLLVRLRFCITIATAISYISSAYPKEFFRLIFDATGLRLRAASRPAVIKHLPLPWSGYTIFLKEAPRAFFCYREYME